MSIKCFCNVILSALIRNTKLPLCRGMSAFASLSDSIGSMKGRNGAVNDAVSKCGACAPATNHQDLTPRSFTHQGSQAGAPDHKPQPPSNHQCRRQQTFLWHYTARPSYSSPQKVAGEGDLPTEAFRVQVGKNKCTKEVL